jgi:hypothetical protein
MLINKQGFSHMEVGMNNQDFGFETYANMININPSNPILKGVVDGCSQCKHAEVGAKLYTYYKVHLAELDDYSLFQLLVKNFPFASGEAVVDYLLFTILYTYEREDNFIVKTCGDGYIIKQRHDDTLEYEVIEQGEYPKYFGYNFLPAERFNKLFKEPIKFNAHIYSKDEYKAIGVATDGLKYILESPFKDEFETKLIGRKKAAIERMITREHNKHFLFSNGHQILDPIGKFNDDVTFVI